MFCDQKMQKMWFYDWDFVTKGPMTMVLMTTSLQLPFFQDVSSVERVGSDRCFGSYETRVEKCRLKELSETCARRLKKPSLYREKVRRKNQPSELMKNLLTL